MKRVLLALLLLGAAAHAHAVDWTGIWNSPDSSKQGFGYNLVESDNYIFGTFYVYGPSGAPTWLVAGLTLDATGNYSGSLYAATGTFFAAPWNPAAYAPRVVGTASFKPDVFYKGTLSFTSTDANVGVGSSTVAIERQTLTSIATGGSYVGGQDGAYTGCGNAFHNAGYTDKFALTITELGGGDVTYEFSYDSGQECTLVGTYAQHGQYFELPRVSYVCNNGINTVASMREIKSTPLSIEGRLSAADVGLGCAENFSFGAVRSGPNREPGLRRP